MSEEIRIILAEDSPTVRRYLASIIEETPGMRVVGEARNGAEAVKMVAELKPDVVSMDIHMPEMDGLEATRQIMAQCPTPVVVVSGLLDVDVQLSLQALESGALAVVAKPPDRTNPAFEDKRRQLLTTLRAMSGVKVIARRIYQRPTPAPEPINAVETVETPVFRGLSSGRRQVQTEVIAIGSSTGGPSALHGILKELPSDLPVPIMIVQHMPPEFIPGLVRWLDSATALHVEVARDGVVLEGGHVYVAQGIPHMIVHRRGRHLEIRLLEDANLSRFQPSVDVLFDSVAKYCGSAAIGVILTGMGEDGASGLLAMRRAGAQTLVQDEVSCTVFGMPRAAIENGAAQQIVPLVNLPSKIVKLL